MPYARKGQESEGDEAAPRDIRSIPGRPLSEEVTIPAPGPGTTVGDEARPVERRILIAIVPSHLLLGTYAPWPWPPP